MKRKITALLLAITTLSTTASFAQTETISGWAKEEVETADNIGLIPSDLGITDYTREITRDKFCSLAVQLIKTKGIDITAAENNPFTDTDSEAVIFLSDAGIIYGKADGIFAPADSITREEAAAILCRMAEYLALPKIENETFTYADDNNISDWAKASVYEARQMGVMHGTNDNEFSPQGTYTAEQSVATMLRLYSYAKIDELSPEHSPSPEPAPAAKRGSLNIGRRYHMNVTVGDNVYVIGGMSESDSLVDNIEVCKGGSNMWSYECSSDYILKNAAAAVNGSVIYIIGGEKDNKAVDTITAYDTETKEWSEIGNISEPVKSAHAACADNKLYIDNGSADYLLVYDLNTQTTAQLDYPKQLVNVKVISHNDEIYIFSRTGDDNSVYVYRNGGWEEKAAASNDYRLFEGQSDGNKIYFCAYTGSKSDSILEYDTENDSWRIIMDSYIADIAIYGFALCRGYAYLTGGINEKNITVSDSAEPYYYLWTYADYDADSDISFKKTIGFEYEPNGKTYDTKPAILTVDVKVLDKEKKIYELTARYTCDANASPFFFWESYSGCFDGADTDYRRVIYHADSKGIVKINVGIGDGSGYTDKKSFTISVE